MTKNLFKRYIWLIDVISQADRITFDNINAKWQKSSLSDGNCLPKKTFHNHKSAIEDIFGINIGCDTNDGYQYYIENFENIDNDKLRKWMLNTFSMGNLLNDGIMLKNRIQVEEIPSGQQHLTPIIEAMRENRKLEIIYQSYWKEHENTFLIAPYLVKLFKQRWYVVAHSEGAENIRIYSLDRIKQLSTLSATFEIPKDVDFEEFFLHCYGIINDESIEPCLVEIVVTHYQAKYLRGLPLHHSQKEIETGDETSTFEYFIKPTYDFKKELLSMGADIEVLKPQWLKEDMMELIKNMNLIY